MRINTVPQKSYCQPLVAAVLIILSSHPAGYAQRKAPTPRKTTIAHNKIDYWEAPKDISEHVFTKVQLSSLHDLVRAELKKEIETDSWVGYSILQQALSADLWKKKYLDNALEAGVPISLPEYVGKWFKYDFTISVRAHIIPGSAKSLPSAEQDFRKIEETGAASEKVRTKVGSSESGELKSKAGDKDSGIEASYLQEHTSEHENEIEVRTEKGLSAIKSVQFDTDIVYDVSLTIDRSKRVYAHVVEWPGSIYNATKYPITIELQSTGKAQMRLPVKRCRPVFLP